MAFSRELEGRRVRLVRCTDIYTKLQPGDCGTIESIDDVGTVFVRWDKGHRLGLVYVAGDRWEILEAD